MKILNADTVTSHKTDEFSNNTINCDKVNSNENEIHMSQHDKVYEYYNEDDSMDTSIVHNSSNKEHMYSTETPFRNEVETWKGKKIKTW